MTLSSLRFSFPRSAARLLPVLWMLAGGAALAQSPVCQQIQSELSQLAGGGGGVTRESARLRTELQRLRQAMQQNECNRRGFLIFGGPPPVCEPLRAQAAQYEARIRQIEAGGADTPRRAQLVAALERYGCLSAQPPQQRGVIYALPGMQQPGFLNPDDNPGSFGDLDGDSEPQERLGGRMAVCVRLCDGFYFPVNFEGIGARDEYAPVCQSLCPGAETQVFFMPLGAEIDRAATRDGHPYTALPAAGRFQQVRDPACFCKRPDQTWASAMRGVEDLVERRKGDIVVTPEQSAAMSRPRDLAPPGERRANRKAPEPAPAPEEPASLPESALPTGGQASSGIGPAIPGARVIDGRTGRQQQGTAPDGTRRQVRNVAPELTGKEPRIAPGAGAPP